MSVPADSSAAVLRPTRVGVLGAGTVGAALLRAFTRHPEIEVTAVLVRDPARPRSLGADPPVLTTDPARVLEGADVVVELLGGVDLPTDLMARAAALGARLVTANKAALAERWDVWSPWVRAGRVGFEAAVMAGTPVVGPLAGALRGSRLVSLEAVLNGTCAYLIGEMERGVPFAPALAEAVRIGYAEADPSLDVDGLDAAHKLTLLARLTVDPDLPWAQVRPHVRGIRGLTPGYLRAERAAGRRVRLVGFLEPDGVGGWRIGVEPRSLPASHPLTWLAEGRNALVYRGDGAGEVWIAGPGAGAEATASAVLADVLQAARGDPGPRPPLRSQASPRAAPAAPPATTGAWPDRRAPDAESASVRFVSTRDPGGAGVGFEEALLGSLAPDGGLYVPERIPRIGTGWRTAASLADAAEAALAPWFSADDAAPWLADVREALDFPVPLRRLDEATWLLELFHGPTRAFKDVAARTLARWWARILARHRRRALVLVATSGDTGGAVAAGMAGVPGLEVVVLFPRDGVSPVQRAQLTADREGVHAFAVDGSFDDCQRLVKGAFGDPALAGVPLASANSINLGRWLPQAAFHVWGLAQLAAVGVDPGRVVVVVPSGNLGDLAAGLLAAAMGAAPARFVAAHNANAYLVDRLAGRRAPFEFPATIPTLSNAMDVGAPSNYERLHRLWGDRTPVPLSAVRVDDAATLARMAFTHRSSGTVVCPHTAVGLEAAARDRVSAPGRTAAGGEAAWLVLGTAHPAKFPEVVERALPGVQVSDPVLAAAMAGPSRVRPLMPTADAFRDALLEAWGAPGAAG